MTPMHTPFPLLRTLLLLCMALPVFAKQPNFVLIFCDDLGYADIGAFGSDHHRTPHIDQMAKEGMRLTNFYSTCCVCTPSRSSLMTGCYPKRIGMHENEKGQWVLFPGNSRGINADETTMAEALKSRGYATAIVGKWHLGDQPAYLPTRHGFDSYFGIPFSNDMGKMDRPIRGYPPTPLLRDEEVIEMEPDQRYITRRYTEEALSFIEANRDGPFFLYLPHSMPHWPQYSSAAFADKSANKAWGDAVEEIDWSTGRILARLKELGIDDNTLVLFTSDNGGAVQHGAVNKPLRGGKGSTWEGGQRVCFVARWPGQIPAASESDAVTVTFDLLPTFCQLAGEELQSDRRIDGKDISAILTGKSDASPHEAFFYYYRGNLNAVRSGDWKYFERHKPRRGQQAPQQPELYNLQDDVGETKNCAADHPEVVARMKQLMDAMRQDLGDDALEIAGTHTRPAGHVDNPTTLTMNAPDELRKADVFVSGADGYHTFRIPALMTTQQGSLLAFCEGRKNGRGDHGDLDLVMKRSDDLGETWSDLQLVYEEGGDENITIGNPCPVQDQSTGTIWLPFCRDNREVLMTYSKDDGRTWAKPFDITKDTKAEGWGWYATGPGVGIQMTRGRYKGRMVIPCDHREMRDGKWIKLSHVFYSDDHGETWKLGGSVADHTDECQVVELHDGRLMINMRNYWKADGGQDELGGKRAVAISDDGGESWQPHSFDSTLIEPICQASFIKHSNDTFRRPPLLFSNPASTNRRQAMTVRVSTDDGQTWPVARVIEPGPAAYSCLTVLPDRSIGCLYEVGRSDKIVMARFTLPWLESESKSE